MSTTHPPPTTRPPGVVPVDPAARRPGTTRLVVGVVLIVLSLWPLIGGVVGLVMMANRGADDYYMTDERPFRSDGYAVVTAEEVSGMGPDFLYGRALVGPVRITGQAEDPNQALFLGLGPADDVTAYLAQVQRSELVDVNVWPFLVDYTEHPGDAPATAPAEQDFWAASQSGTGTLTLATEMPVEDWKVVVMNADGSSSVTADLAVGATLPVVAWSTVAALVTGALLLIPGSLLVGLGRRAQRTGW